MSDSEDEKIPVDDPMRPFLRLRNSVKDFMVPREIPVVDNIDPVCFLRDYVAQNRPVLLRGMIQHWPALSRWSLAYFREKIGDRSITVAVTPDGYGDAVKHFPGTFG
jgi:jumonji domain-containing protein 7